MSLKQTIMTLNKPKVMGQFRHLINTFGAVIAARGAMTGTDWELYSGLGLAVIAFAGSLLAKEKQ